MKNLLGRFIQKHAKIPVGLKKMFDFKQIFCFSIQDLFSVLKKGSFNP
jgi:hypothetical protein